MIALIQRVQSASVTIHGQTYASINSGLLIFLGIHPHDTQEEADWIIRKCVRLRIFSDEQGRMNLSVKDIGGEILLVSQFTLYGNATKGNRPSFVEAAHPKVAEPLYDYVERHLSHALGKTVASGVFGASMQVSLINDGPVTLWVERPPKIPMES
ncbi:MAG: D-aminoacyl-tRNA deacylase [Bacteroidetes bacterium]|nr:D-aminoacyl-tRNA deacylase [Bacteroidota bacterium]